VSGIRCILVSQRIFESFIHFNENKSKHLIIKIKWVFLLIFTLIDTLH